MLHRSFMVIILLVAIPAFGQTVIRQHDIPVAPGTVLSYFTTSDPIDGLEVDVGLAGEDRRWDVSGYAFDEVSNDTLIDPEEAPDREVFANANRVLIAGTNELGLNIGSGLQYEAVTDSGWFLLGVTGGGNGLNIPIAFPNPIEILPLPAEFGDNWEVAAHFDYGMPAPDTLLGGILDSVYIRIAIGGFSELDGWGVIVYSGGEVPALRQRLSVEGTITVVGVRYIFNQRIEIELPFGYEIQATQSYRWLSPSLGEIARITSLAGEAEPNFNRASTIRVRRVIPSLHFPQPPVSFGIVHIGNSGMTSIRIGNTGEGVGSISRVAFSGGLESEIEVITDLPLIIERDSSAVLRFIWTPVVEKALWPNTISIHHNDPEMNNPLVLGLQGATPDFASVYGEDTRLPGSLTLYPPSPNPFNSVTTVSFDIPISGIASLLLYDSKGRFIKEINNGFLHQGRNSLSLSGEGLSAGSYQIYLQYGKQTVATSIIFLK